ncbi:GNAT family N-acetyltransferase [Clostridium sp. MSJ-4]|uniref:GNAT family N-acetyltransferase n=1 Tax=Clostridium simiarum TaxID=2841506 RepID=A0ABS6F1G5_9CLOT|nr:GNAT family N-acetyltransferase [Clostridium simiarum]MBU5592225.1 GNAT family N-acetyltransferase [Clostridium simiarum]
MNLFIKKFHELSLEELYDILALRSEIFVVEQNCIYEDCDGKDKFAYHLYYKEKDEILAYSRILDKGISYGEISIGRVVVNKNHRRKGLAEKMMKKAIEFVEKDLRESSIRLSAQVYAKGLYESVGFKEVSEEYLEDNIPHIEMLYQR